MRRASKREQVRVTLDLSPQLYSRLVSLEEEVDADSKAQILREALRLYEYLVKRSTEGVAFQAVLPDGEKESIVFLGSNA